MQGFVLWSVDIKILKNAKNIYQNKETGLPMGVIPNKYDWCFSFSMQLPAL
ncbi:hypothetical protein HpBT324_13880 [Helicobacter pylori]|uniref:hypothetical protein n=1 Tax=Helicobacter pylori TaxID=210 RepID=UPI0013CDE335|nr:hypothetical protein [Helicobacter pylori]